MTAGGASRASRPHVQEVSLARLLRIYEARAAAAAAAGSSGPGGWVRARPPRRSGPGSIPDGGGSDRDGSTAAAVDDDGAAGDGGWARGVSDDGEDGWRRGPKAQQHLEAMKTLLAEVRAFDADAAATYATRVERVERMLEPYGKPAFCVATSAPEWRPYRSPLPTRRRGVGGGGKASGGGGAGRARGTSVKLSEDARAAMARQRDLQEGLTDEMVELASSIKANSLAMEASLKESRRELDAVETNLERNVDGVKTAVSRQSAIYKLNASGGCWTWIVLIVVGVVFTWTFVYIRFTSDKTIVRTM